MALFDQSLPFGRLALVHSLQAAGTALVTVSLAGSLFFSISPDAAKSRVLLYLLLTIAPFALVGPTLSPLLDIGRGARRVSVGLANGGSALFCLLMARDVHNLLLFPEAFGILVLGKLYLVARASLVPEVIAPGDDLATANAKLAVLASLAGFAALPIGIVFLKIGAPWVLRLGAIVFAAGALVSFRLPRPAPREDASATPAEEPAEEPVKIPEDVRRIARRPTLRLPTRVPEVLAATHAVAAVRGVLGFTTFFLAFALRRAEAGAWWFGLLLLASGVGSLIGSLLVPPLRRRLSERQIIGVALVVIVIGSLAAGLIGHAGAQALLTLVVGMAPTTAKPALDSLVQRFVPPVLLSRTFGRVETRLQLWWVLAALVAVVIPFPVRVGDATVAAASLLALLSYATGATTARVRRATAAVDSS